MASVRCEGNFGAPSVVFELPGQTLGSLSLGPGELELIYATSPIGQDPQPQSYRRSLRASTSVPFSAGEPLPELDAACGDATLLRSGDLSLDGLRYYFVCYPTIEIYETPLRLARRASLDAPFVVEQQTYGEVYPGPTLGPDELELLTSPSTNGETPSMRYLRSGQSAEFVLASSSPSGVILRTPEISPDGRFVFGTTRPDGTPTALVMAERAAGATAFGMPVTLTQARAASDALGSAAISGDCRSLYYVEIAVDQTTSPSTQTNRVLVMKR
jgi:hypothetical protein